MKVLHILNRLTYSGAEVMLKDAVHAFQENGLESHVLSTGDDLGDYAPILERAGYVLHHIPFRKSPLYVLSLFRFLRKEMFDIVHIHPERAFFWHSLIARAAGSAQLFRSVHNVFLFSGWLKTKRTWQRSIARKWFGVHFIAIGESVKHTEQELYRNQTSIIKNWVDELHFRPPSVLEQKNARSQFGFESDDYVIVSVATCSEVKNHAAIIGAIRLLTQIKGPTIRYFHQGSGPTLQSEINLADEYGVRELILFRDFAENVRQSYWASDVFVMTSRYEGLPKVALEAMNCSLPVILYNNLGLRDTLPTGRGGILVEPSEACLASAIEYFRQHPQVRKSTAREAFLSVRSNFSMNESLSKLVDMYKGEKTP